MRILVDEYVPRKLKNSFPDHECGTVPEAGLAGTTNGNLLSLAEAQGFDLFFTMDKGIEFQQNLAGRSMAVLVVRAKSNRLADLLPHVSACRSAIRVIQTGQVVQVGW
jgi:hypothetical protein